MTVEEFRQEIQNNPDSALMMAYRIGYAEGLRDKALELAPMIEKLIEGKVNE
jgi:hypothetical protein